MSARCDVMKASLARLIGENAELRAQNAELQRRAALTIVGIDEASRAMNHALWMVNKHTSPAEFRNCFPEMPLREEPEESL